MVLAQCVFINCDVFSLEPPAQTCIDVLRHFKPFQNTELLLDELSAALNFQACYVSSDLDIKEGSSRHLVSIVR